MLESVLNQCRIAWRLGVYSILLIAIIALTGGMPLFAQEDKTDSVPEEALLENKPWMGDFDAMAKKRQIRVLVAYSKNIVFAIWLYITSLEPSKI